MSEQYIKGPGACLKRFFKLDEGAISADANIVLMMELEIEFG